MLVQQPWLQIGSLALYRPTPHLLRMPDPITRLNAALEGRYAIERELGEGGMATVYLADDLKHERKVALKVLKPELAAVVGAERFLAEIKTTANLTHPHILPLFDSGEADSFLFYVMPHIEGESLRERIDREKQLGVDDALAITQKVAYALDYAHTHGVVHRDIKPGNILLSEQGEPLIADFGIALAVAQAGAGRITETGLSLGTPHYMSPEQATGDRDVDPRSDVYALGCVLYEMLAGQPPFSATTAQAVLVKILTVDAPSITSERRTVPQNVGAALAKSLEKLPADRFTSAAEFGAALADPSFTYEARARTSITTSTTEPVAAPTTMPGPWKRLTMAFAALAAVLTLTLGWSLLRPQQPRQVGRFELTFSEGQGLRIGSGINVALSPDGSRLVYAGQSQLWQRRLNQLEPEPISGTAGGRNAVFSPDGTFLAFYGDGSLKTVSLLGGPALTVVASGVPSGAGGLDWGSDGMLYFTDNEGAIQRVPASGGEPTPVTTNEAGTRHQFVAALPESQGLLFTIRRGGPEESEIAVMGFDDGEVRTLLPGAMARYATSGHLVYAAANGTLLGALFDLERLAVTGPSVGLLEGVSVGGNSPSRFALSETGTLLYVQGVSGGLGEQRLLVVDLQGNEEAAPLAPRRFLATRWSPDGESVAYNGTEPGSTETNAPDIYTYNVALRTAPRRLTFEGENRYPVWSPDGTRVAFASIREGTDASDLFVKTVNDDSPPQMIVTLPGAQIPNQWPSDDLVVFESGIASDLWMVDLSSDSVVARPYLESEADLYYLMVSPDGDLAAYTSDEAGRPEVYVRSFPDARQPDILSQGGGRFPLWSPDGNTVYYWTLGETSAVKSLIATTIERGPRSS